MGPIDDVGLGPLGLDTAPFIYLIEEHTAYLPLVLPLFEAADRGRIELGTSAITLFETLVVPYRAGDRDLAERYEALLTRSRGVRLADIERRHLRAGAALRAATGIRTPDALQLVAALERRSTSFVTNDRRLPPVRGLRILQLSDYIRADRKH